MQNLATDAATIVQGVDMVEKKLLKSLGAMDPVTRAAEGPDVPELDLREVPPGLARPAGVVPG